MTPPRHIIAGKTYLVTRRCAQRCALFDPTDPVIARLFRYLLAVYARRHNIAIHAVCVMSNHIHIVLTDLDGRLPDFCRDLFSVSARCINERTGHTEALWNGKRPDVCELSTATDVLGAMTYVMSNPVHHDAVDEPSQWPGFVTKPCDFGCCVRPARPRWCFSARSRLPKRVVFSLQRPSMFAHLSDERWQLLLERRVRARARAALNENTTRRQGTPRRPEQRPGAVVWRSPSGVPVGRRRPGRARPAVRSADRRIEQAALERHLRFRERYESALDAWREGDRQARFPDGTWRMRVLHNACCGEEPLPRDDEEEEER